MVSYLLMNQADITLRDKAGNSVKDYSRTNRFTKGLINIYKSLGFSTGLTKSLEAQREIQTVLREPEALRSIYRRGDHHFSTTYFYQLPQAFRLFPSGIHVRIGEHIGPSTIGFISGHGESSVERAAISGYKTSQTNQPSTLVLNKETYTSLVREVCQVLDFRLPGSQNDNGGFESLPEHKGRYHACQ